jgi:hypothetical protein
MQLNSRLNLTDQRYSAAQTKRPSEGDLSVTLVVMLSGYAERSSGLPPISHKADTCKAEMEHGPSRRFGDGANRGKLRGPESGRGKHLLRCQPMSSGNVGNDRSWCQRLLDNLGPVILGEPTASSLSP